jgi:formamidopyrimidine-DNA glycosylase
MPELAEVEVVRRAIAPIVDGQTIESVVATGRRSIRRHLDGPSFASLVQGRVIEQVSRWGKYLLFELDRDDVLVVHLRMSGQLRSHQPNDPTQLHTHVVWRLDNGIEIRFVDPRTFGEQFVVSADDLASTLALGPDPFESRYGVFDVDTIAAAAKLRRRPLKSLLLDQQFVAGVGNIYADEICWRAGVRPTTLASRLASQRLQTVMAQIPQVLDDAIACGGSTLRDGQYVDVAGRVGSYQKYHGVHARQGLPCPRCATLVKRVVVGGRSTYFCPACQR